MVITFSQFIGLIRSLNGNLDAARNAPIESLLSP